MHFCITTESLKQELKKIICVNKLFTGLKIIKLTLLLKYSDLSPIKGISVISEKLELQASSGWCHIFYLPGIPVQVSQVCLHEGESEQPFYGSTEDKDHIPTMAYKALTDLNLPAALTSFHYFPPFAPPTLVFISSVPQMLHVPSSLIRVLAPAVLST